MSIKKNPHKYDIIPNNEEYRSSKWYWPEKKGYHKGDPPDLSSTYSTNFFIESALYFFASSTLICYTATPRLDNTVRFIGDGMWIGISLALLALYSFLVSLYFPLFSKTPRAICFSTFHIFPKRSRSDKWKLMTRFVLIATIFLLPFRILALSNTGYANKEGIVYHPYWSVADQHFVYDEIVDVQVDIIDNRASHCYLINSEGKRFDLLGNYINIDFPDEAAKDSILRLMPEDLKVSVLGALEDKGTYLLS